MILAIHSSCNVNGMYHTQLLKEWEKKFTTEKDEQWQKGKSTWTFPRTLCLPTTVLRNKPNANWHIQFQFLIWINFMPTQGSLNIFSPTSDATVYYLCGDSLFSILPHPKLSMQTEPWHPELCFLLHSGSSDMWHNLLGITGTRNLLLELPVAADLQRGPWTQSRWMLKALVLLLRALGSSLDSPTLSHAGQVTEGSICLLTCKRITYLPASFDSERVIHTDAQGGSTPSHHDLWEDIQHQTVRQLTCGYLQPAEVNLTLLILSPSILGEKS